MNDLEDRLSALRPIRAPRAIFDRARRGRRPWLLAWAAAAAALAVVAFILVSAPPPVRRGPASDYRSLVDRLLKAGTLDIETRGAVRSGPDVWVERRTVLRLKSGNRLHAVLEETRRDKPELSARIQIVSDGSRTVRIQTSKDNRVQRTEQATPPDLQKRIVQWLLSTGELWPFQTVYQVAETDALTAEPTPVAVPQGFPPEAKAWSSNAGGYDVTLVYDPARAVLLGRSVKLLKGGSEERFVNFRVDAPLDDALFVLPE